MSRAAFLDRLLDGVAVEWKALGDVAELVRGNGLQKKDFTETGVPAIHYGQIYTYYGLSTAETRSFVSPELAAQLRKVNKGDVVITNTSENIDDVGKALVYLGERQAVTGGHATVVRPGNCLLGKYFAYFTQTETFASDKRRYAKGTKVIDVSATDMAKITIPMPCPDHPQKSLAIQAEIVRILDAFTATTSELTHELTRELTARKKQYQHYRDELLRFEDGDVEWSTLGGVANIQRGASPRPIAHYITADPGGIPWIRIGDTSPGTKFVENTAQRITADGAKKSRILEKGDFIISNSMSFGRPYILGLRGAVHDGWASISEFQNRLYPDFLYHYLSSNDVQNYWASKINSGSVSNLNADIIKTLPIPIPALSKQRQIASLLDTFDTLTNSISAGLPREIALRQQQYAHYRERLLAFPKPTDMDD